MKPSLGGASAGEHTFGRERDWQKVSPPFLRQVSHATSSHDLPAPVSHFTAGLQMGIIIPLVAQGLSPSPTSTALEGGCPNALEVPALYQLLFPLCWELLCHTGWGNKARTARWWNGSKAFFVCFSLLKSKMMSWRRGGGTRKLLVTLAPSSLHNLPCHAPKSCAVVM